MQDGVIMNQRDIGLEEDIDPLAEYEHLFRTLFERSDEGILVSEPDINGRILEANQAAADIHGYTITELARLKASDLHPTDVVPDAAEGIKKMLDGQWVESEHEHLRKDGSRFPVRLRAGITQYLGRKVMISFVRDVTDERRLEETLRQCERELSAHI
jgi:two-component system, cell cycle sensor histidine kinase and response regulator CckA